MLFGRHKYSIDSIRTDKGFKSLRDEWNGLLCNSWSNNIFLTWEWMYTWWKVFRNENDSLAIITIREKRTGRLLCVAPFRRTVVKYYNIVPVARYQFIGTGEDEKDSIGSKYLDIIGIHKGRNIQQYLLEMVFTHMLKKEIWDEIILENLRDDSRTFEFLKDGIRDYNIREQFVKDKEMDRYLVLPGTWDKFLSSLFPEYRKVINKVLRAFEGIGKIDFKIVETEEDLDQTLKDLIALQRQERVWKAKKGLGDFSSVRFHDFHSTILKLLFRDGNLMMVKLTINGKLYGVIYNIYYNRSVSFYHLGVKKGVSQQNRWIRPKVALHIFAIKKAIEWGCKEYDFLMEEGAAMCQKCWLPEFRNIYNVIITRKRNFKIYTDSLASMYKDEREDIVAKYSDQSQNDNS